MKLVSGRDIVNLFNSLSAIDTAMTLMLVESLQKRIHSDICSGKCCQECTAAQEFIAREKARITPKTIADPTE